MIWLQPLTLPRGLFATGGKGSPRGQRREAVGCREDLSEQVATGGKGSARGQKPDQGSGSPPVVRGALGDRDGRQSGG